MKREKGEELTSENEKRITGNADIVFILDENEITNVLAEEQKTH